MATKAQRVKEKTTQLHQQSRLAKVGELKAHPKNPNIGDVSAIRASLRRFGQYRPVVNNLRNGFIVAGHHTWIGAREEGWEHVSVVDIDVDEETHLAIMVADNRISDLRQTDEAILDEILQHISVFDGTGFTGLDADELHARVEEMLAEGMSTVSSLVDDQRKADIQLRRSKTFDGSELGEEPEDEDEFDDEDLEEYEDDEEYEEEEGTQRRGRDKDPLVDAEETMNGGLVQFTPPEDLTFDGVGELQFPKISTDPSKLMRFEDIPENLVAWAGSATKENTDPNQWWLYNWGIDSTSGMTQDRSQVIVSFYCYDEYFDNWWWYPERYAAKLVNSGIKYILGPDYSISSDQARVFGTWQLYRSRWLSRYFQEIGLKLLPHINWRDGDELFLKKYVLGTLPKNLPCIAMQAQTIDVDAVEGGIETYLRHFQMVLDELQPKGLLLYSGKQANEILADINYPCPVFRVESRLAALGEQAKKRKKKKTI